MKSDMTNIGEQRISMLIATIMMSSRPFVGLMIVINTISFGRGITFAENNILVTG